MGQAWCKEKSSKAQDSKSPLDRVFVRCAHRIYPSLKEEGSVLGGATQRVTSSEIGYASSPPRSVLLRGQSIDSVDRPFHPSEWVDVNLEVPCTPRASIVLTNLSVGASQQRSSNLSNSNVSKSLKESRTTTSGGTPVPPPRRRRRRERRPLPPKPDGGDAADDESEHEPEPLYSKLASPRPVAPSNCSVDDVDGPEDSDDEFIAIERMLKNRSHEDISPSKHSDLEKTRRGPTSSARPKNHSVTSLPNVGELLSEDGSVDEGSPKTIRDETAKRPRRHIKTTSLPRDASLFGPATPERIFFSRKIVEDRKEEAPDSSSTLSASQAPSPDFKHSTGDNSIFKIDASAASIECSPDCSLRFETDAKTSTPVKAKADGDDGAVASSSQSSANLDDVFRSFKDESQTSRDTSSRSADMSNNVGIAQDVDRPANVDQEPLARINEDVGYESKTSSNLFSEGSNESGRSRARHYREAEELSSGILKDATVNSTDSVGLENPYVGDVPVVGRMMQRTISEESLPREMLVDELDDEDEEEEQRREVEEEKSAKDASNEMTRQIGANENESFKTPPPSPESKILESSSNGGVEFPDSNKELSREKPAVATASGTDDGNLTSMTPSLMELEAALSDMLEKRDEEEEEEEEKEREEAEESSTGMGDKSSDASPEPQIVPVKRNRPLEDVGDPRKVSPQPTKTHVDEQSPKSRLIDFPRVDRTNPFNDLKSDDYGSNVPTDEPPEKPSRLHRVSLIEESVIDEPVIVPTPPRRRHRSKSNLGNTTNEVVEAIHTYATSDRLI